ncbi:ABC transporter substrate-binding protein [Actinopolymorpha sp. B11F2]|uniref:ABC transporter substrate-binding protein n=1 Tax=Actinopolymorpha sp. B11F2 TaxID=3160862 RepID=UPI0032E3E315
MSRRDLLRTAGSALLVTASLSGCDLLATDPEGSGGDGRGSGRTKDKEAPDLAAQVKAGKLPSLAERLPVNPLVVEPVDSVGVYGGTWRSALLGPADTPWLGRTVGYECLLRWDTAWTTLVPNIAEGYEVSADARTYEFTLREGMRWSDGEPFGADDLVFACADVFGDESLYPAGPPFYLTTAKGPARVTKVDDLTVSFEFADPSGLFLNNLATGGGAGLTGLPRHHLEKFHRKYNPDAETLAKDEGFPDWVELFTAKSNAWANNDLPTLCAWRVTTPVGESNRVVVERNPYYWKTDPDGRQLPYLDSVVYDVVQNDQVILLKAGNGELDMQARHINVLTNKPVLAGNREKGHFDFFTIEPCFENQMVIALNLTHDDPELRRLFQNRDVRVALSHAIDRQELITSVFQRQGLPWQAAPRRESPFYDEAFATQYLEYDESEADELLDEAGYRRRDAQGFRLLPGGRRISFDVEVASPALVPYWTDAMQLVRNYWAKVGVEMRVKAEDRALFYERKEANKPHATVWTGAGGREFDVMLDPRWYFPFSGESNFAIPWATWFTSNGESGLRPPATTRRQMELHRELRQTPDEGGRAELMTQILTMAREEFYVIGTILEEEGYGIVSDRMHNVPKSMPESHLYNTPGPTNPEQYYIEG